MNLLKNSRYFAGTSYFVLFHFSVIRKIKNGLQLQNIPNVIQQVNYNGSSACHTQWGTGALEVHLTMGGYTFKNNQCKERQN